jgi:hypothetical protein
MEYLEERLKGLSPAAKEVFASEFYPALCALHQAIEGGQPHAQLQQQVSQVRTAYVAFLRTQDSPLNEAYWTRMMQSMVNQMPVMQGLQAVLAMVDGQEAERSQLAAACKALNDCFVQIAIRTIST